MNAALVTVLLAAIGTALLAFAGFRLGLNVERRLRDAEEVLGAVRTYVGSQDEFVVLLTHNQRTALAHDGGPPGYIVTVLGDKLLVRSMQGAKIMVIAPDRLYVSFSDVGFEPVHIHADAAGIRAALVAMGRDVST